MTTHANESKLLVARARRRKDQGGAALVEYAVLLFAVLICGAGAVKAIGPSVACAGANATDSLAGGIGGGCEGATASASGSGGASGGSAGASGATAGSSGGGDSTGGGAGGTDESGGAGSGSGSGGGGYIASSSSYDDGAGGLMGGSGSSNGYSGSSGDATNGDGTSGDTTNGDGSFASEVAGTTPKPIDLTLAKLSSDVYGGSDAKHQKGADGYKPLTAKQLAAAGITPNMLQDKNSGFVADVYTNGKGDYVVAYRGTMMNATNGWAADGLQGAGIGTAQYAEGARLGKAAKNAFGNNVVFTGHSLGGGLAASSAAETGLTAVTFNAAGLSDHTLVRDGVNPAAERAQANNGQVRRYEVKGEMLSGAQNAPGSPLPQALGRRIEIQDPNPALTAADRKQSSLLNPWPVLNRAGELHGDYLQGLRAGPVKYQDANGKTAEYSLTNPPHS